MMEADADIAVSIRPPKDPLSKSTGELEVVGFLVES